MHGTMIPDASQWKHKPKGAGEQPVLGVWNKKNAPTVKYPTGTLHLADSQQLLDTEMANFIPNITKQIFFHVTHNKCLLAIPIPSGK